MSSGKAPLQLTPLASALAGALGGCFSTAVVYPLDVAKTRIQALPSDQLGGKDKLSMWPVLLDVFKKEGISGWYRGFTATMINTFSQQYAYFFFYAFVRTSYIKRITPVGSKGRPPALSTAAELLLGAIAGALAQIFTIPVSVIATRQQVGQADRANAVENGDKPRDESFFGIAKEIIDEEGPTGLWLGLKPGLVLTVNPAITYGVFERVKNLLLAAKASAGAAVKLTSGQIFLVGALSKTLATVVTYPYIMAKIRIQARSAHTSPDNLPDEKRPKPHSALPHHHVGALTILRRVLQHEGISGWYQGMQAQITKAVISQALLFLSKEQFEQWAVAIILIIARLRRHKA